ncbi:unnamed protein product [Paramecium pentaurelia]|uniref:Uncharacterized protein n=1 Tax=Paramecium pentaurelia TaxID=43138 RepID=A0A8S1S2P5_9CILI|nr:unnamed protein product [Paramecium pentaurelia]
MLSNRTINLENDRDSQLVKSGSYISIRLNDLEKQSEILLPISSKYLKKRININNLITKKMKIYSLKNVYTYFQQMIFLLNKQQT